MAGGPSRWETWWWSNSRARARYNRRRSNSSKRARESPMISRRRFTGLAGSAAALIAAPHIGRAQSLPLVRLGNAAGLIDPQVTFLTMGQHPRLKYYEQEGCRMEIINLSGV